jgi:hypothetical protein
MGRADEGGNQKSELRSLDMKFVALSVLTLWIRITSFRLHLPGEIAYLNLPRCWFDSRILIAFTTRD